MTAKSITVLQNFFKDKDDTIVIGQWPNIPIIGWLIFKVASMLANDTRLEAGFSTISTAFLFTWAFLEIQSGVNYFRKLLGLVVMTALVIGFFN